MKKYPCIAAPSPARRAALCILVLSTVLVPVYAQTVSETTAKPSNEEIETLSLFEVKTGSDTGYLATNTLSATGFNRDVQQTPLMINILTDNFIQDAGLNSYADLAAFLPNTYVEGDMYNIGSTATARGHGSSYYSQDGRRYYTEPIVNSGQRVEAIKGPATLFFGRAQPGGILNFATKPPSAKREVKFTAIYGPERSTEAGFVIGGKVFESDWLTFRVEGTSRDGETWIDNSYDDLAFVRTAVGIKALKNKLNVRLKYEYSLRQQSGFARAYQAIVPQYFADYNAPRPEQLAWAKAAGRAGVSATDAQATAFLRNRWLRNDAQWSQDVQASQNLSTLSALPTRTGFLSQVGNYGWNYNASQDGSFADKEVTDWGGSVTFSPNQTFSFKLSGFSYDLDRHRLDGSLANLNGDGKVRNNIGNTRNLNETVDLSFEAVANYGIGKTKHTTHAGIRRFKDVFSRVDGLFYGLNAVPGGGIEIRRSTASGTNAVNTSGWDPNSLVYDNISRYVSTYAKDRALVLNGENYEDAYYGSHILELLDGRLNLLIGGRHQEYENRTSGYQGSADVYTSGISWEATQGIVLFASKSTSFEPGTQFMVEGNGTTLAERNSLPSPPKEGEGFDIGVKFNIQKSRLAGSISYFDTAMANDFRSIDQDRTDDDPRNLDSDVNNNVTWYTYGGERLSRGVDAEIFWKPNANYSAVVTFGYLPTAKITKNISLVPVLLPDNTMGFSPLAENLPGSRTTNSPKYTASLWNRYVFSAGSLKGFGIGLGISYTGSVAINTLPLERFNSPSETLVRLAIDRTFKINKHELETSLIIANLLDEEIYRGRDRASPRTFSVRASYKY